MHCFKSAWPKLASKELTFWEQINRALYAEADLVPTTSRELLEYSMLEENGAAKYDSGEQQLLI